MYHGKTASEPDEAGKLFMALNIAQAEKDLTGADPVSRLTVVHVQARRRRLLHGRTARPLRGLPRTAHGAVVDFYGIHPNVTPDYARLSGPVLGLFAEKDAFVTPETARGVEAAIKKAGKVVEIHVYPAVDHAFFNDTNAAAYDKASAADAWRRTLAHFRANLK